jgi:hypothetical protein
LGSGPSRPPLGGAPTPVAVEQSSGRNRLNIHGAIDLETEQTIIKDVLTVDALNNMIVLRVAMLTFLRDNVTRNWKTYRDEVTDNFRIIDSNRVPDYRVIRVYYTVPLPRALSFELVAE